MTTYTALSWKMVHHKPLSGQTRLSRYIIIDCVAINVEVADGVSTAVAIARPTHDEARQAVLDIWMPADEKQGLVLDGAVTATQAEVDLNELVETYRLWGPMKQSLRRVIEQINATGVPL